MLLIDDSEDDALLTQRMLAHGKTASFTVDWAPSYAVGLERLTHTSCDVSLIDYRLDAGDGIALMREALNAGCHAPMIMLTGLGDEHVDAEAMQAGAADYLVKGKHDADMLQRVIRHAIERHRAQAALSAERQRLRTLIDTLPDFIYFKDTEGRFIINNNAHIRILGAQSQQTVTGRTDFDLLPPHLASQFHDDDQRILATGEPLINRENVIAGPEGHRRWLLTTKVPLRSPEGTMAGIVGMTRDITALKEAEEKLQRAHDELEQRVIERTAELSEAVAALRREIAYREQAEEELRKAIVSLERHDKAKSEFVTNVSHELKTPLTSMLYGTRNLLKGIAGPLPEEAVRYLRMFDAECQRLVGTINDILNLSKIDNQTLTLSSVTVPLIRLVTRSLDPLRIQADTLNTSLKVEADAQAGFVRCDPSMMQRVLQNIVSNAVKFTPPGGHIRVRIGVGQADADMATITVTDDGIGIPAEALSHVTERYYRAANHPSGSGIGLSISKEIVLLHGGQLTIVSPPQGMTVGTEVTVTIPKAPPPLVLLADDDLLVLGMMESQLTHLGYRVRKAAGGHEALRLAEAGGVDLMIIDLVMRDMHGCDLILKLKSSVGMRYIPIIAVTGATVDERRLDVLTRFAVPALPKPWRKEDLQDAIETALTGMTAFLGTRR